MTNPNAKQVGGAHYQTLFQHWDLCAELFSEAHFKCTATKYLVRWRDKNGLEDLEKAKHYLEKLIDLVEHDDIGLRKFSKEGRRSIDNFAHANKLPTLEAEATKCILTASDLPELYYALELLQHLINTTKSSIA